MTTKVTSVIPGFATDFSSTHTISSILYWFTGPECDQTELCGLI